MVYNLVKQRTKSVNNFMVVTAFSGGVNCFAKKVNRIITSSIFN